MEGNEINDNYKEFYDIEKEIGKGQFGKVLALYGIYQKR